MSNNSNTPQHPAGPAPVGTFVADSSVRVQTDPAMYGGGVVDSWGNPADPNAPGADLI